MRIVLLLGFLLSILPCYSFGEAFAYKKSGDKQTKDSLRIGALPAADSLLLYVAEVKGVFDKYEIDVEIVPFQSAVELGAAMHTHTLDGHFGDIINVLIQNETGVPQKIIATTSHAIPTQRHFALILSPTSKVQTLEDLKGKQVGIGKNTIVDYLLTRMVKASSMVTNNIPADGKNIKNIPANDINDDFFVRQDIRAISVRLQLLMAGHIDAALLPEPLASTMEARGARVLLDDTILFEPLAVIAFKKDVIKNKDLVVRFRKALYESAQMINDKDKADNYINIMVKKGLLSMYAKDAYTLLSFDLEKTPIALPSEESLKPYMEWMQLQNILKKVPQYDDIVWHE